MRWRFSYAYLCLKVTREFEKSGRYMGPGLQHGQISFSCMQKSIGGKGLHPSQEPRHKFQRGLCIPRDHLPPPPEEKNLAYSRQVKKDPSTRSSSCSFEDETMQRADSENKQCLRVCCDCEVENSSLVVLPVLACLVFAFRSEELDPPDGVLTKHVQVLPCTTEVQL